MSSTPTKRHFSTTFPGITSTPSGNSSILSTTPSSSSSSSSYARKRHRKPDPSTPIPTWKASQPEGISSLIAQGIPSDTIATILSFREEVPLSIPSPIVTISQIYSVVTNRTDVDREISIQISKGVLRKFKMGQGSDFGVMLMADYSSIIDKIAKEYAKNFESSSNHNESLSTSVNTNLNERVLRPDLYERFINYITKHNRESVDISRTALKKEVGCHEDEITELCSASLLSLHPTPDFFYFSSRGIGAYHSQLAIATKDIVNSLRKKKFKELLEKQILLRSVKGCSLFLTTVIAEMVGKGIVTKVSTPQGALIKLTKAWESGKKSSSVASWSGT